MKISGSSVHPRKKKKKSFSLLFVSGLLLLFFFFLSPSLPSLLLWGSAVSSSEQIFLREVFFLRAAVGAPAAVVCGGARALRQLGAAESASSHHCTRPPYSFTLCSLPPPFPGLAFVPPHSQSGGCSSLLPFIFLALHNPPSGKQGLTKGGLKVGVLWG